MSKTSRDAPQPAQQSLERHRRNAAAKREVHGRILYPKSSPAGGACVVVLNKNLHRDLEALTMVSQDADDWRPYIRVLIYPVLFEAVPRQALKAALRKTVGHEAWRDSQDRFLAAIDAALARAEDLSRLLPQRHSDAVLRDYLHAVKKELLSESGTP